MNYLDRDKDFYFLTPAISLCVTGVEAANQVYFERYGVWPTTLLVSPSATQRAYEIIRDGAIKLVVVPTPGLHRDTWSVFGESGFIWSLA